jgi:predicted esterase
MRPQPDFIHEFVAGNSNRTLLLLHGTGGDERDLIPLGRELATDFLPPTTPGANKMELTRALV